MPVKVKRALDEFVEACKEKFGEGLVSVVLFGSYARGNWKRYSDVDLLVVVRKLPRSVWERDKLLESVTWDIFLKHGEDLQPILTTESELREAMKACNPIFFGILLGYRVIYDPERFFERSLKSLVFPTIIKKRPIFVYGGKRWDLEKVVKT